MAAQHAFTTMTINSIEFQLYVRFVVESVLGSEKSVMRNT